MTAKNVKFYHHEIVHPEPYAAAKFLQEVLGAEPCETSNSDAVEFALKSECKHMLLGGAVFQILQPGLLPASWQNALEANGPCIHNICLCLDNVEEVKEAMLARGCKLIGDMEFTLEDVEIAYPAAKGKGIKLKGCWIDAIEQTGLRFELISNEIAPYWPCLTGKFR